MSHDLRISPNSEYVYAAPPPVAPFWGKRGRGIDTAKPLSMIFTILSHRLNTPDVNNYFGRGGGQLFCLEAMLKWAGPLSPLDVFPGG